MMLDHQNLRRQLLDWYDINARDLPWRVLPNARATGVNPDPYRVWLSEIMLQQTTIATVKPYHEAFLSRFPNVQTMAEAPLDDVLARWAGLGYYARARNMHKCAGVVARLGGFPKTYNTLIALPGIGPYTAAAIAAIAFDQPQVPVDGNVERALSRLLAIQDTLPAAKPVFRNAAVAFESPHRPGDFAQALMDLGSTICTPRKPKCGLCPWQGACKLANATDVETYPRKSAKKQKPIQHTLCFVEINAQGILVQRRSETGLLGGMLQVPNAPWRDHPWQLGEATEFAPVSGVTWQRAAPIRHIFTHIDLRIEVYIANDSSTDNATRVPVCDLDQVALPSVFLKVIKSGLLALEKEMRQQDNNPTAQ